MSTIEKRGNSYRITVSCGYDSDRKQIKKRMTWTPKPNMTRRQIEKELDRQAVLFEEKCQTGQFLDGNITLADFSERWFKDYAEKQLKERTLQGYKGHMPRILKALGHIRLAKLQPHHIMEFYNNLAEEGVREDIRYKPVSNFKEIIIQSGMTQKALAEQAEISENTLRQCINGCTASKSTADKLTGALQKQGLFSPVNSDSRLADTTIAKYHRVLSSMLTAAVQWQVIPSNPCSRVKPPHVKYKEAPVLDEEQTAELIKCLQTEPIKYRAAVMMILYTGLRRGELCGLDWKDIDFKTGIVHVTKAIQYTPGKGVYEDTTKTRQSNRAIRLPDDMLELLKEYRAEQSSVRLAMGNQWHDSGKIFTAENGGIINPDTLSSWFREFIKRHNLPDAHIHTLRHVSATLLIAGGVDIATVSKRLGHASKSTTLNLYTHAIKSADEAAAETLQNILNPSKNFRAG